MSIQAIGGSMKRLILVLALIACETPVAPEVLPIADFRTHCEKLRCGVFAEQDGTIVSWHWQWGDGTSVEHLDAVMMHDYASEGDYTVTLTVTTVDGREGYVTHIIQPRK
jgi:PKD repeat protein